MLFNALRSGNLQLAVILLALSIPSIVLCICAHEAAHGGMAYVLGDRTARNAGRLTLSPLAHIDPFGFLCLLLFGFGWAKPVPVNISNFKNRRVGMALTALAGPAANILLAFVLYVAYYVVGYAFYGVDNTFLTAVMLFLSVAANLSVGLGVFNLIPVYPLDGSRVIDALMPFSWSLKLQRYQGMLVLVFVIVLWMGWLSIPITLAQYGLERWAAALVGSFF